MTNEGATPQQKKVLWVLGAILGSIFVFYASTGSSEEVPSVPRVRVGEIGMLMLPGGEGDVLLCADKKSHDEFISAAVAKDNHGIRQLILTGRAFLVDSKTKAQVLETGFSLKKVRILEGTNRGQAGWIDNTWMRKQ